MDKSKFISEIEKLRLFSSKLKIASENEAELVIQINAISKVSRIFLYNTYQNSEGPIKSIRKKVSEILNQRDITLEELKSVVDNAMNANPKSFGKMYKSWYNMLYMFLIADFKNEMNDAIEYISNSTLDALNEKDRIITKTFDFTGERETGSTRCWIAFINSSHPNQTSAKQLFLMIDNSTVEYCFYDRPRNLKKDITILEKGIPFNFDNMLNLFQNYKNEIISDTWTKNINYWRIGTSDNDEGVSYWEEMKEENKVCIGWSGLGNLYEAKIKNKKDVIELLTNTNHYKNDERTKSRKAGEIFDFYSNIKEGDIVLAQKGSEVFGIGLINGMYDYNIDSEFSHQKSVEWLVLSPNLFNDIGLRTTVYKIQDNMKIKEIENLLNNKNIIEIQLINKSDYMKHHLNHILYGPPGTGKTYNTINKAIEIINPAFDLSQDRDLIKKEFERLMEDGQIVFTTFHQSMSYEDFIEGIKPLKPLTDDAFVKYDIQPGIFYTICENAKSNFENAKSENKEKLSFEEAFVKFKELWEQTPDMKFPLKTDGYDFTVIGFTNTSIQFKKASGGSSHTLSIGTLKELYYGKEYNFNQGVGIYYPAVLKKVQSFQSEKTNEVKLKIYVIIIDEINRGNISQIFGELITLIEEDKRLGMDEALEVTLPYSKEQFGVPPNLYIIGTMNTADRSVEALDAALRRRFSFEEIRPNPELVSPSMQLQRLWIKYKDLDWDDKKWKSIEEEYFKFSRAEIIEGKRDEFEEKESEVLQPDINFELNDVINFQGVNLEALLTSINNRIEKLLDKDHQIGHSYFISVFSLDDLNSVFYKNIIPLLQEYFFGDYGKIGLVLGKGFIHKKIWETKADSFADFDSVSASDFDDRDVYEIIDYRNKLTDYSLKINGKDVVMNFEKAIKLLMKEEID